MNSMNFEHPALILNGNVNGLWAARELGKHNISVQVVAKEKNQIALWSKYCEKRMLFPRYWSCQDLKRILRIVARINSKRVVVYPLSDMDALNLSRIKDDLPDDYFFVVGGKRAVETLINKRRFYHALDENNVEHPITFYPQGLMDAKKVGQDLIYPVFIRPSISELFGRVFGFHRKGFVANSYRELLDYYRLAKSNKLDVMFQEIIHGPAENSLQVEGYFNKESYSTGLFARQRLRIWPPDFGNSTFCVSVPLSDFSFEIKKITQFMKKIGYNGLASAEFKRDGKDGKYKLLEVNARPWLHFWLAAKCGVEIIFSSYLDAIGEKTETKQGYLVGIKSLGDVSQDMLASAKMIRERKLSYASWLCSFKGIRRLNNFEKNDLLPFFYNVFRFATGFLSLLRAFQTAMN
jgi:predicted ATP-grasp superfamily ATP-dependent carboligase